MIHYASGTPRNDVFQTIENTVCTARLFSMHGTYRLAVMRWLKALRDGIRTVDDFVDRYPSQTEILANLDTERRRRWTGP